LNSSGSLNSYFVGENRVCDREGEGIGHDRTFAPRCPDSHRPPAVEG
jgi:hypothetical protein